MRISVNILLLITGDQVKLIMYYVNLSFFECVHHFKVHDPNILSDHSLVNISFNFNKNVCLNNILNNESENNDTVNSKFVWKNIYNRINMLRI